MDLKSFQRDSLQNLFLNWEHKARRLPLKFELSRLSTYKCNENFPFHSKGFDLNSIEFYCMQPIELHYALNRH